MTNVGPFTVGERVGSLDVLRGVAAFSLLWLRRWEMGPAEWLLRSLTYGRWQAVGRAQPARATAAAE